ncbi:hypothetical protein PUNSTDRAFT_53397, partial [Punctularia strigosozonata HHB-11173 SS5]|uniref:uncharacterized protein n=1 Tax=Punctularia strigosozonata (strain HHB-11173) TaxID=741275 RepID=UPI00044171BE
MATFVSRWEQHFRLLSTIPDCAENFEAVLRVDMDTRRRKRDIKQEKENVRLEKSNAELREELARRTRGDGDGGRRDH